MTIAPSRPAARLTLACLILALGFGLRVHRLAASNIWWDEAWGVVLSRMPLSESLQRTASDEHPPLYYWSLHFWSRLSGEGPFAARSLSAFAGVLTLAVLYQVGRRLGGTRLSLLAALLLALSRFHITWSQQVKMYALAALFTLSSFWFLLQWWDVRRPRWVALGYGLSALAAIYSHYIALLVIAAQGLGGVWWGLAHRGKNARSRLFEWLALNAGLVLSLIPWGLYLLYGAPHPTFAAAPPLSQSIYLPLVATVLTLGFSNYLELYRLPMFFILGVSLAWWANWFAREPVKRLGSRVIAVVLLLPVGLIYALSLVKDAELYSPKFDSRYLLLLAPLAMLVVAGGLDRWARWQRGVGIVLAGVVVALQLAYLPGYYQGRRTSADFPTLMKALHNLAQPQDGIIVYSDKDWPVFAYYHKRPPPWVGIPSSAHLTPAEVASRVDPVTAAHESIWVVMTPDSVALDPGRTILARVAEKYPLAADLPFGEYRLQLYSAEPRPLDRMTTPPEPDVRLDFAIPSLAPLKLIGYDLPARSLSPGDYFPVTLYWDRGPGAPATTWSLQLRDSQGAALREASGPIGSGATFAQAAFPVSSAWASGRYPIRLVVRRPGAQSADEFTHDLVSVVVQNAGSIGTPPEQIPNPRQDNFEALIMLEGSSALPPVLKPGENLTLTLYWRAQREMSTNYTVFVHLLGEEFNLHSNNFLWGQVDSEPQGGRSPTSSWTAGQRLADAYVVQLSPDAPAGRYQVEVGLYDHSTGQRLRLTGASGDAVLLGSFRVP